MCHKFFGVKGRAFSVRKYMEPEKKLFNQQMWGQENCFEKTNLVLVVFTWNLAWSTRQSNKYQVRNETARINNKNMEWCWYALLACNRHRQLALKWWSPIREASVSYFIHEIKCYSFFRIRSCFRPHWRRI